MRFLGNIEAKMDAKGRAFLPSGFRKELDAEGVERLVVRKDVFTPCLVLYPENVWNSLIDTMQSRLSRWNGAHRQIMRQFVSDVEIVSPDSNGRVLISARLRQLAGITGAIRFIGMDDTIELWSAENSGKPFMEAGEFSKALEDIMSTGRDER